jgi:hypothetical protein
MAKVKLAPWIKEMKFGNSTFKKSKSRKYRHPSDNRVKKSVNSIP